MCSGGGGGEQLGGTIGTAAPVVNAPPPVEADPIPITKGGPDVPKPLGGDDPTSPGYRGTDTSTTVRTVRKKPVGSVGAGTSVPVTGGSGVSGSSGTGIKM